MSLLTKEWTQDEIKNFMYQERISQGISQGISQTVIKMAKKALKQGATLDFVATMTGLDLATLKKLQQQG